MISDLLKCMAILALGFFAGLAMLNHIGGHYEEKKHVVVSGSVHGGRISGAHMAAKAYVVTASLGGSGSAVCVVSLT